MGQKVNPHGIRVGVIKDWDSRWFASKKDFSDNLVEDHKIRTELKAQLKDAGVPKIEIERTVDPSHFRSSRDCQHLLLQARHGHRQGR